MAVAASLTVTPSEPAHGDTITATYHVTGNDPVPTRSATISGDARIGVQDIAVSTTVMLPGTPALPESFTIPTCPDLTFTATSDPAVFTAVVP